MVREAQRAGLRFDEEKLRSLRCNDDLANVHPTRPAAGSNQEGPQLFLTPASPTTERHQELPPKHAPTSPFLEALETAATRGRIHDCLSFNNGLSAASVFSWRIMEYLPFRRMDLQPDGSWKPIRWPLPRGEVRDIPDGAQIHHSALKRMAADPKYRPGNLIVGGGGRGVRVAPKEAGVGNWVVFREHGDAVGEVVVRAVPGKV